jgi:hypothetical protein
MSESTNLSGIFERFYYVMPSPDDQELASREWALLKLESIATSYVDKKTNKSVKVSAKDFWNEVFSFKKVNG